MKMELSDFLNEGASINYEELYILMSTESAGTRIYVDADGELFAREYNIVVEDDSVFLVECDGDFSRDDWNIMPVYDEDEVIGYIDGSADGDTMLYREEEDCFIAVMKSCGVPADFIDDINNTEVEI